jgi:hypothetical protein
MAYRLQQSQRSSITPTPGERSTTLLLAKKQTQFLDVLVSAQLDITVAAATAIRNRGSILAAFDEMGITEAGGDKWVVDPRVLKFLAETAAPSALTSSRLTSTAVGTYQLKEHFRIALAHPFSVNPRETAYMEHDPTLRLEFFAKLNGTSNGVAKLVNAGGATVALSNIKITIRQGYDGEEAGLPLFIPLVRALTLNVAAASTELPMEIKTTNRLRAMVVSQDTTPVGEVTDIINKAQLRGDSRFWLGPEMLSWDELARAQEFEYGGDVYSGPKGAHVMFNFQRFGRLADVLNPAQQDINMRWVFDCQPSVTAGVTSSIIRVTLIELVRDGYVGPDGRRVVAPVLPYVD